MSNSNTDNTSRAVMTIDDAREFISSKLTEAELARIQRYAARYLAPADAFCVIQGRVYTTVKGLISMAHKDARGLLGIKAEPVVYPWDNDAKRAGARAIVRFKTGEEYEAVAFASPDSIGSPQIKANADNILHMACTRATGRALRLALGLDITTAEEVNDAPPVTVREEPRRQQSQPQPAAQPTKAANGRTVDARTGEILDGEIVEPPQAAPAGPPPACLPLMDTLRAHHGIRTFGMLNNELGANSMQRVTSPADLTPGMLRALIDKLDERKRRQTNGHAATPTPAEATHDAAWYARHIGAAQNTEALRALAGGIMASPLDFTDAESDALMKALSDREHELTAAGMDEAMDVFATAGSANGAQAR